MLCTGVARLLDGLKAVTPGSGHGSAGSQRSARHLSRYIAVGGACGSRRPKLVLCAQAVPT